jgi:hypothetical protein
LSAASDSAAASAAKTSNDEDEDDEEESDSDADAADAADVVDDDAAGGGATTNSFERSAKMGCTSGTRLRSSSFIDARHAARSGPGIDNHQALKYGEIEQHCLDMLHEKCSNIA